MRTTSVQRVDGVDYFIMDEVGRSETEQATGVFRKYLVPNSQYPYCDIPIDLQPGDKLFFRLLKYNGDVSKFDFIYLYDTEHSESMGGVPSDAYGKTYTISNNMSSVRVIAKQTVNVSDDIEIEFAMYVQGTKTLEEIRTQLVIQEQTFHVTAGTQMIYENLPIRAKNGDILFVQVEGNGHIDEMVVGYTNNGTAVNNVLGFDPLQYKTGYAKIGTNFDDDSLRIYTKAASVLSTGDITVRWANASKVGMSIPFKQYSSFSVLGDSFSTCTGYTDPTTNRQWYPTNDPNAQGYNTGNNVTDVKYTWWYILCNETDLYLMNNASYSGSTIGYDSYGSGTADGKTTSFITRTDDLAKSSLLFVFGGTNDAWAQEQIGSYKYSDWTEADLSYFAPAVAYLIDKLQKQYIGMKIVFIENDELASAYKTAMETVCDHYSVPVIKLSNISKTYSHPNIVGMRQIADQVKVWVNSYREMPFYIK